MGSAEVPQPALDQRRIGQDPTVQGGVVHLQAALPEQLLDVTIAERIAQVPGDGLQDQRRLEVAALEVVLGAALQLLDKGVQDHGPPPDRKSTRLNSSHANISYAVFCLKKKKSVAHPITLNFFIDS